MISVLGLDLLRTGLITRPRQPCSCGYRIPTRQLGSQIRNVTYRSNPFLASTLYTCPIKVTNLGSTLLVRADNLASDITILEDRFHPGQLNISPIPSFLGRLTGSTKYPEHLGFTKIAGPALGRADP